MRVTAGPTLLRIASRYTSSASGRALAAAPLLGKCSLPLLLRPSSGSQARQLHLNTAYSAPTENGRPTNTLKLATLARCRLCTAATPPGDGMMVKTTRFPPDEYKDWVADLSWGCSRHLLTHFRQYPPFQTREWVTTPEGKSNYIGFELEGKTCGNGDVSTDDAGGAEPDDANLNKNLLIVWHSRTGMALQMSKALEEGAVDAAEQMGCADMLTITSVKAADATLDHLLTADGYLFCAPENLASLSGEMKEFFDRLYYPAFEVLGGGSGKGGSGDGSGGDSSSSASASEPYDEVSRLFGRPYGLAIAAGSDGSSAARQVARICLGWRLKSVCEPVIQRNGEKQTAAAIQAPKKCPTEGIERCKELGGLVAATVLL